MSGRSLTRVHIQYFWSRLGRGGNAVTCWFVRMGLALHGTSSLAAQAGLVMLRTDVWRVYGGAFCIALGSSADLAVHLSFGVLEFGVSE